MGYRVEGKERINASPYVALEQSELEDNVTKTGMLLKDGEFKFPCVSGIPI